MVVCTYQPDTLTVRASFSVPGRGGVVGASSAVNDWDTDRNARNRKFKMVGKSALVLKEDHNDDFPSEERPDTGRSDLTEVDENAGRTNNTAKVGKKMADNLVTSEQEARTTFRNAKYARLINEKQYENHGPGKQLPLTDYCLVFSYQSETQNFGIRLFQFQTFLLVAQVLSLPSLCH